MNAKLRVVVTGADGFIGKNLVIALRRRDVEVIEIDRESSPTDLADAVSGAGVVFHLAGVNRPESDSEFLVGNVGSVEAIIAAVEKSSERPTIVLSSSTQALLDNPYGRSKLAAEEVLERYATRSGTAIVIYRFPGVFGKWCRPNYNSVVATFCHNIARDLPISVSDPARSIDLVYVDDIVSQFLTHLDLTDVGASKAEVQPVFSITLSKLADLVRSFRESRKSLEFFDVSDSFTRRLLGVYTSYLPHDDLAYHLEQRSDARGTLAELAKSEHFGQIFVSRTRPGMTRGNHYHDMKVEKFCVLEGDAIIRFRPILADDVTDYRISGSEFRVVDIPPGMTHSIENVGTTDMIVLFWASEIFDSSRSDTYFEEVLRG